MQRRRGRFTPWKWERTFKGRDGVIYAYCPEHPWASEKGWIPEHVLIMENVIRGPIPKMAWVVHVNGDVSDNRPENLTLRKVQDLVREGYFKNNPPA